MSNKFKLIKDFASTLKYAREQQKGTDELAQLNEIQNFAELETLVEERENPTS